jgi:transposase
MDGYLFFIGRGIVWLDAKIDEATKAYQVEVNLLQTILVVGKDGTIDIISEVGINMDKFPDENHLSSWSGMSPIPTLFQPQLAEN